MVKIPGKYVSTVTVHLPASWVCKTLWHILFLKWIGAFGCCINILCLWICCRWTRRQWRGWWSSTRTLFSARWCRTAREPWRELIKWAGAPTHQTPRSYCWITHTDKHTSVQLHRGPVCARTQMHNICSSVMFASHPLFKHACEHVAAHSCRSTQSSLTQISHPSNPSNTGLLVF